ncbi:MAG: hypothetical protein JW993_04290 [Sedimentisphaerales bacterium]|nr:hypothetical protein [Sedimentisphaerales bacterium]
MKVSATVIATFAFGLPGTWASEPNDLNISLEFEVASKTFGPLSLASLSRFSPPTREALSAHKPFYVAGVPVTWPSQYFALPGRTRGRAFISFAYDNAGLGDTQRQFLHATEGLFGTEWGGSPLPQTYTPDDDPNAPQRLLLYAVSLEDAKAMARAYFRYALESWRSDVNEQTEQIARLEQSMAVAREQIDELDKKAASSEQALDALKRKVPYRATKEATEAIAELDQMLNAAQVDIAGIRARIEAIQDYLRSGRSPFSEAIRQRLQGMFVEESIALQGAQAREKMATQLRTNANRFLDLTQALDEARINKNRRDQQVLQSQTEIANRRNALKRVMSQKPQVPDGAIPVYPVEWTE